MSVERLILNSKTRLPIQKKSHLKKNPACLNGTQDEELQSNNDGVGYSNSCYIQDEDSDEYFGVSYDDKMKMPCTKITNLDP